MTLRDLETAELESVEKAVSNKLLRKLIETRVAHIKEMEWERVVSDRESMLCLATAKGMVSCWEALLKLPEAIKDERALREQEKEKEALAQESKK